VVSILKATMHIALHLVSKIGLIPKNRIEGFLSRKPAKSIEVKIRGFVFHLTIAKQSHLLKRDLAPRNPMFVAIMKNQKLQLMKK